MTEGQLPLAPLCYYYKGVLLPYSLMPGFNVCARHCMSSPWNLICIFCHSRILSPVICLFSCLPVCDCKIRRIVVTLIFLAQFCFLLSILTLYLLLRWWIATSAVNSAISKSATAREHLQRKFTHKLTSVRDKVFHHACGKLVVAAIDLLWIAHCVFPLWTLLIPSVYPYLLHPLMYCYFFYNHPRHLLKID